MIQKSFLNDSSLINYCFLLIVVIIHFSFVGHNPVGSVAPQLFAAAAHSGHFVEE